MPVEENEKLLESIVNRYLLIHFTSPVNQHQQPTRLLFNTYDRDARHRFDRDRADGRAVI